MARKVEVTIKVTSDTLEEYTDTVQRLEGFTGDIIGLNPVKDVLSNDENSKVIEVKVTASVG